MLNYTFDGFIRDADGDPVAGAYYQMWFRKVNGASSASTWGPVKEADSAGYYNANLGDGDWLTQDGIAAPGDQVVIAAWVGEATRAGTAKTAYIYTVITLTSAAVYTGDLRLRANTAPTTVASGPATVRRLASYPLTNVSHDDASWTESAPYRTPQYQTRLYSAETIFAACGLDRVDVTWGDGETSALAGPLAVNGSHIYDDPPGTPRTITVRAHDLQGAPGNLVTWDIGVLARVPTPGLSWLPSPPTIEDLVTFTPSITDDDTAVTSVDYSVDGGATWDYTGLAIDEEWTHTFLANGAHSIHQRIHWHDGVGPQTTTGTSPLTVANILPTADFGAPVTSDRAAAVYSWTSTSTDPDGGIASYAWVLERDVGGGDWQPEGAASGAGANPYIYTFTLAADYRLTLTVTDVDGGVSAPYTVLFTVVIDGGSGGGSGGYSRTRITHEGV